jgi:Mg-chelatase subunit ChlD
MSMQPLARCPGLVAVAVLLAVIVYAVAIPVEGRGALTPTHQQEDPLRTQDLAFFTVAYEGDYFGPECGKRINVVRTDTGGAVLSDHGGGSPLWLIRAAPNLDVVVAGVWGAWSHWFAGGSWGSIQVLRRSGGGWEEWDLAATVIGPSFYSGIDIMPDGNTLLIATTARTPIHALAAPFRVEQFLLSEMTAMAPGAVSSATHRLGPARGSLELPEPVTSILVDPDGHRAHLLTRSTDNPGRLGVRTIDVPTMTELQAPVELPLSASNPYPPSFMTTMAALSPDARYLVTTAGPRPDVNVADLVERRAWSVPIQDALAVTDVSFSHGPENSGLLALNLVRSPDASVRPTPLPQEGRTQVLIGQLHVGHITEFGRGPMQSPYWLDRPAAVEWTADGSGVLAAAYWPWPGRKVRAHLLAVEDGGRRVSKVRELDLCSEAGYVTDILTGNGYMPTATITPPPSASPSQSPTPTHTPLPSASPTPAATATSTATAVRPPLPIYLPIALREHCTPGTQRIDVALVIDASTTMRDDVTSAGRTKLSAAIEASTAFVATMSLPQDQAAVVAFNNDAAVLQGLTGRQADIEAALHRIPRLVRRQTRIDLGIEKAHQELQGARRNPVNRPVMILLTDGLANPEPASTAVRRAEAAKNNGITIFTIGLGKDDELNVVELAQMASRPGYFYRAPDGEDLLEIYRTIAVEIPCPASGYWGRR